MLITYILIVLLFSVLPLIVFYTIGTILEKRHFNSIRRREEELRDILIVAVKTVPEALLSGHDDTCLVTGSCVVASDYFKSFWAKIATIFGGRIKAFETVLERGRRESLLRMKEEARKLNAKAIINVKFSTANLRGQEQSDKNVSGCLECFCYGTVIIPKANQMVNP